MYRNRSLNCNLLRNRRQKPLRLWFLHNQYLQHHHLQRCLFPYFPYRSGQLKIILNGLLYTVIRDFIALIYFHFNILIIPKVLPVFLRCPHFLYLYCFLLLPHPDKAASVEMHRKSAIIFFFLIVSTFPYDILELHKYLRYHTLWGLKRFFPIN